MRTGLLFELFQKIGLIEVVHCEGTGPSNINTGNNGGPSPKGNINVGNDIKDSNVNINVAPNSSNSSNNNVVK